jgi:hypothetical protein
MNKVLAITIRLAVRLVLVLLVAMAVVYCNAVCQTEVARVVVIKPHAGQQLDFQLGYQRHLEWHRKNKDPWTWYGWRIATGERVGCFMDGTFGHAWKDFDAAVNPSGDAADNALNVVPYADFISVEHIERLAEVSNDRRLEERKPGRLIELHRVSIRPGFESEFENLLARYHALTTAPHSVYRSRHGTETSDYLLIIPLDSWSAADGNASVGAVLRRETKNSETLLSKYRSSVDTYEVNVLVYLPDMSYFPE